MKKILSLILMSTVLTAYNAMAEEPEKTELNASHLPGTYTLIYNLYYNNLNQDYPDFSSSIYEEVITLELGEATNNRGDIKLIETIDESGLPFICTGTYEWGLDGILELMPEDSEVRKHGWVIEEGHKIWTEVTCPDGNQYSQVLVIKEGMSIEGLWEGTDQVKVHSTLFNHLFGADHLLNVSIKKID